MSKKKDTKKTSKEEREAFNRHCFMLGDAHFAKKMYSDMIETLEKSIKELTQKAFELKEEQKKLENKEMLTEYVDVLYKIGDSLLAIDLNQEEIKKLEKTQSELKSKAFNSRSLIFSLEQKEKKEDSKE